MGYIWRRGSVTVMLENVKLTPARANCEFELRDNGELIFRGRDSIARDVQWNSEDAVMGLLAHLTLRPGEMPDCYFAGYNERQMVWVHGITCNDLRWLVFSYECQQNGYRNLPYGATLPELCVARYQRIRKAKREKEWHITSQPTNCDMENLSIMTQSLQALTKRWRESGVAESLYTYGRQLAG